ncbi:MAG: HAD-IIIA family hydrolase [Bacteroidales bacterium]|nr:HAD-IIIA family hydrolase [Bacteroidales bacterium]
MKAVILAGGKGTRLADYTREIPKPMLRIGGESILEHQINLLIKYQVDEIIILVNYLKDIIMNHFGDGSTYNLRIRYFEETEPLGTVGGIKEVEEWLTEDFFVLYGDVMVNIDLGRLKEFHRQKKSQCTLVLHPNNHPYDSDLVEMDENDRIMAFHAKPHDALKYYHNLVNAGVYLFSPDILKYLEKGKKADFGREVFPRIFKDIRMYGYNTSEYLKDMGTPERWEEVNDDYKSGRIFQFNYENSQKAVFLDRDGVLNVEKSFISKPEELELYDFTAEAVRIVNGSEYLAIVVTNQSVIARNLCTLEELDTIHKKLETELGNQHAKLDAIYFCPHHPDKGYAEERAEYKIDCDCRKPKPGLFFKAARQFNINLTESWMIGDSERDILAGKNAGCKTVGVMTGYGCAKTSVQPDFFFADLHEAVNFIVKEPYAEDFNILLAKVKTLEKRPVVISVAGNSRSGKSNLVSYLNMQFQKHGFSVLKIELDNWILPENKSENCKNVFDRFQGNKLENDIVSLLNGQTISLMSYASHPQREPQPLQYTFQNEDIVLIDGIVALGLYKIRKMTDIKIFMDMEETMLRERIKKYYSWRQKEIEEIELLYQKRKTDEYQLIEKDRKFADFIINAHQE